MKRLTFHVQIRLTIGLYFLCFILAHVFKQGWLTNVGWIIYGLFFIINPVWPQSWDWRDHNVLRRSIRIAGVLAIIIGLITRFGVYTIDFNCVTICCPIVVDALWSNLYT